MSDQGPLFHVFEGFCPDDTDPDRRDSDCPACIALQLVEQAAARYDQLVAAIVAHRDAIAAAGEVRVFDAASAQRAAVKHAADRALWALVEGDETTTGGDA